MPNETIKVNIRMLPFLCVEKDYFGQNIEGSGCGHASFMSGANYLDKVPAIGQLKGKLRGWIKYPVKCEKCSKVTNQAMDVEI